MSAPDGGAAFPHSVNWQNSNSAGCAAYAGMSLRDYFAAKAMQGILSNGSNLTDADIGLCAFSMADAMLKAREAPHADP